jgi:NDP-sugar pyrophosphorylase family protein
MKTQILILAAGMGSRFGGIKQIAGVGPGGEAVLEYSIYDALEAGFDEAVFLIRRDIEADFRDLVLSRLPARVKSRIAFQELESRLTPREVVAALGRTKPWGTGHALLCAESAIDSPFAVINADDFYGRASLGLVHDAMAETDPESVDFCMAGFALGRTTSPNGTVSRGLCDLSPGNGLSSAEGVFLRGVVEHPAIRVEGRRCFSRLGEGLSSREVELPADAIVSMNLFGFTPTIFGLVHPLFRRFIAAEADSPKKEFGLPTCVDELISSGQARVRVLHTPETWFGITYREDLAGVRERIAALSASGLYPSPLWSRR